MEAAFDDKSCGREGSKGGGGRSAASRLVLKIRLGGDSSLQLETSHQLTHEYQLAGLRFPVFSNPLNLMDFMNIFNISKQYLNINFENLNKGI